MRSKALLNILPIAVIAVIGAAQLHQALPIMARLAHRTAVPLERMVLRGVNPSYPESPAPAVQPFVATPVQVCDRTDVAPRVHVRQTVLHVQAPRVQVETIADPIVPRLVVPRRVVRVSFAGPRDLDQLVQLRMQHAEIQRQVSQAQRQIEREMRDAQRRVSF